DKTSLNTAAVQNPHIISEGADKFGSQCIVIAIDARRITGSNPLHWEVYTHGGQKPTGLDAVEWAYKAVSLGAGEILLTSMDADGQQSGYDNELTRTISETVNVPVIASGGAGTPQDLYNALVIGKADAVLAASILHYNDYTIKDIKEYLFKKGIPVRK
ncbi:MAG: HisA/HisF-related TIM barrel protein, partial [Dehalococcoidales bacterium]